VTCACLFPCLLIRFCLSFVLLVNPRPLFLLCSCWFIVCSVGCWLLVAQGPSSPVVALLCGLFSIFLCCSSCFWHCSKLVPADPLFWSVTPLPCFWFWYVGLLLPLCYSWYNLCWYLLAPLCCAVTQLVCLLCYYWLELCCLWLFVGVCCLSWVNCWYFLLMLVCAALFVYITLWTVCDCTSYWYSTGPCVDLLFALLWFVYQPPLSISFPVGDWVVVVIPCWVVSSSTYGWAMIIWAKGIITGNLVLLQGPQFKT
jgi:hypothetical protein